MDAVKATVIVDILDLAARYGIPAVLSIIGTWTKDTVTKADVDELKHRLMLPDDYLDAAMRNKLES